MTTDRNAKTKLIIYAGGIFVCYFYFAVLQEKITRGQYGDGENKEKFTYTFVLVFIQCLINYCFAKVMLAVLNQGEDTTSTFYYASSALAYILAMVCSIMALQFVNYPTQVVGKAGKPIPVMVLGVLIGKKVYPARKYVFIILIVTGVILFMFKDNKPTVKQTDDQVGFGECLLILSLLMDGITCAIQDRMRAEYKTKSGHMMINMNMWSVLFTGVAIIVSGELLAFIQFLQRHPNCLWHILSFSIAGALGQHFIFLTIAEFGPLTCAVVTTTRKFFTVLGSVLLFGNTLLPRQWIGTVIVFTGLALDALYGKTASTKKGTIK
ncbi:solute carrier family 35 member B1 [Orussus abietinus]|uniref:solute carrier family 35 member B1 n=1 Tax=Orussus abietinus TaxID=222816 RepID=UPI0006259994|nr:solute carrier family 35 member B1 [Orussus abietinus]